MSGEEILRNHSLDTSKTVVSGYKKKSNRVDINILLSRVRDEKKKQSKENLVFFGLISSVIIITGIIASL